LLARHEKLHIIWRVEMTSHRVKACSEMSYVIVQWVYSIFGVCNKDYVPSLPAQLHYRSNEFVTSSYQLQ